MTKLLVTTALTGLMVLSATSAQAFVFWPPHNGGDDECVECLDDAINLEQVVSGFQKAFNNITDVDDVTDATQTAVNAANLISLDDIDVSIDPIGEVDQDADPYLFQFADNDIMAGAKSSLYNIEQSASNIMNMFSAPNVNDIDQNADGTQWAYNTIVFGSGGYDADSLYDEVDPEELMPTQAALNAANLITVDELTGKAEQYADVEQEAINTMEYEGFDWHHFHYQDIDIWDVGQTATNVANVFSATEIAGLDCGCVSVLQDANADQLALNTLAGSGWTTDMSNIVQNATNIANSISYLEPDTQ